MSRTRLFLLVSPIVALLAACSGGQAQSPLPPDPTSQAVIPTDPTDIQTQTTTTRAPIQTSGTIESLFPHGFVVQTGYPHGFVKVATSSSTQFAGAKPYAGEKVRIGATGSFSTELQAVAVAQAGSTSGSPVQTSGTVSSVFPGGFVVQTGYPHGFVKVLTSSSTRYTGARPYAGEHVTIGASGSFSSTLNAQAVAQSGSTPQPPPSQTPPAVANGSVPSHIATWAYDEYWGVGARGTAAQVREYLNYAQSGLGNAKAADDCAGTSACKSVFYFDPHMLYDTRACGSISPDAAGFMNHAKESWYVHLTGHSDKGHRVEGHYRASCGRTVPVYAVNTLNSGVRAYYADYLHQNASKFDMFFLDDTSGQVLTQFYGAGGGFCAGHWCSSTQEMRDDEAVVSEHAALANSLTHANGTAMQGVFNGLNFANGRPNDLNVLRATNRFVGVVCEDCIVNSGTFRAAMYPQVLNAMAEINRIPGASLVEINNGESPSGSVAQIAQRTITTAVAWLGYSQGHTIVWPNLEANTQNLAVFPENSIYPTQPLESMSSGATDIQVAPGVYRREFAACYNNRVAIGPCASIVNGTGSTVAVRSTWLHEAYGHVVDPIGGDIPSGGRISLTSVAFRPNVTTIAPGRGMLIVR